MAKGKPYPPQSYLRLAKAPKQTNKKPTVVKSVPAFALKFAYFFLLVPFWLLEIT
jgi:hypothetical protein